MCEKQFNSGYVGIRTLEGDKFLKDLTPYDSIKTAEGYCNASVEKVNTDYTEEVYNVYYRIDGEEDLLQRVSGEFRLKNSSKKVKNLKVGDEIVVLTKEGKEKIAEVFEIEKMDALGKYFYNIKLSGNTFYADGVCLRIFR